MVYPVPTGDLDGLLQNKIHSNLGSYNALSVAAVKTAVVLFLCVLALEFIVGCGGISLESLNPGPLAPSETTPAQLEKTHLFYLN